MVSTISVPGIVLLIRLAKTVVVGRRSMTPPIKFKNEFLALYFSEWRSQWLLK